MSNERDRLAAFVRAERPGSHLGMLVLGELEVPCALGRTGVTADKREGDGGTPAGPLRLVEVLYRADRVPRPQTPLPVRPIMPDDGWCDDPADPDYNRPVRLPFGPSHERLWLEEEVYDILVVLDWNLERPVPGRGSAIFLHVARPDLAPTAGCVALSLPDLQRVLKEGVAALLVVAPA